MNRELSIWYTRFFQPDPYDGSYDFSDPQSLNRYSYTQNDPVNSVDPTGLMDNICGFTESGEPLYCGDGEDVIRTYTNTPRGSSLSDYLFVLNSQFGGFSGGAPGGSAGTPQNPLPGAIDAARDALKDPKSPCAELFSKGNGLEKLNELARKGKIKIGDTGIPKALSPTTGKLSGNPGIGAYAKDGKIFLNPASSIVKGTLNPGTAVFGGMSAADALATLIIHDLRHLTKDLPAESLENYRRDSLLNSQDVKIACFPAYKP
jgi:hypothetical protein